MNRTNLNIFLYKDDPKDGELSKVSMIPSVTNLSIIVDNLCGLLFVASEKTVENMLLYYQKLDLTRIRFADNETIPPITPTDNDDLEKQARDLTKDAEKYAVKNKIGQVIYDGISVIPKDETVDNRPLFLIDLNKACNVRKQVKDQYVHLIQSLLP